MLQKIMEKTYILNLTGIVQGVGFRPFVYKIATQNHLKGYVLNNNQGVEILVQGKKEKLEQFFKDLKNPPKAAKIISISKKPIQIKKTFSTFLIQESQANSIKTATIPADIALCESCKQEFLDPKNHRFLYPFISCTDCGGRYSLISTLPYDRKNTAMHSFVMCENCKKEYNNKTW